MSNMTFFKGMGLGIVVGSVAGMIASPRKKSAGISKTIRAMSDVADDVCRFIGI